MCHNSILNLFYQICCVHSSFTFLHMSAMIYFEYASPLSTELSVNPLESRGNYSATSTNMKLVHWPLMGGLLHLVSEEGTGRGPSPPSPLLTVPNVTAHPSTASIPITVLLYNGLLLCRFSVGIKWLI